MESSLHLQKKKNVLLYSVLNHRVLFCQDSTAMNFLQQNKFSLHLLPTADERADYARGEGKAD